MINYRLELMEDARWFWMIRIYANSDLLTSLKNYKTKDEAVISGKAFINGIKFARGESNE